MGDFTQFVDNHDKGGDFGSFVDKDKQLAQSLLEGAQKLGADPVDYATAISYESARTFDPWVKGPVTKWGQHRGTIQFGQPQQKQYGVHQGQSFHEQVTDSNVRYLQDHGFKPGMGFTELYKAINGGRVSASTGTHDADTGRTIGDNLRLAEAHRQEVINRFAPYWNSTQTEAPVAPLITPGEDTTSEVTPQEKQAFDERFPQQVTSPGYIDTQAEDNAAQLPDQVAELGAISDAALKGEKYVDPTSQVVLEGGYQQAPDQSNVTDGVRVTKKGQTYIAKQVGDQFTVTPEKKVNEADYKQWLPASGYDGDTPEARKAYSDALALSDQTPTTGEANSSQDNVQRLLTRWQSAPKPLDDTHLRSTDLSYHVQLPDGVNKEVYAQNVMRDRLAQEFDLTPEQAQKLRFSVPKLDANDKEIIARVNRGDLADVAGLNKVRADYEGERGEAIKSNTLAQNETADQRAAAQPLTNNPFTRPSGDPLMDQARANILADPFNAGTDKDVQKEYERLQKVTPSEAEKAATDKIGQWLSKLDVPGTLTGAVKGAAWLSDIATGAAKLSPLGLLDYATGQHVLDSTLANDARLVADSKNDTYVFEVGGQKIRPRALGEAVGSAAIQVPVYVGLSTLPGGAVMAFAATEGLGSVGRGENALQAGGATIKGGALGLLFSAAPRIGQFFADTASNAMVNPVLEAGKELSKGQILASKLIGATAEIGTIGGGTFTIEKASGASNEDAFQAAIVNSLFGLSKYVPLNKLVGKTYRMHEGDNSADVTIDPDGSVKLLPKGKVPPGGIDAEMDLNGVVDMKPDAQGVYRAEGDVASGEKPSLVKAALQEAPAKRIEQPLPDAVARIALDTRAQKMGQILSDGTPKTVQEIAKETKYNPAKVNQTIELLYGAGKIEILPDGKIRLIEPLDKGTSLYDQFNEKGRVTKPVENPPTEETTAIEKPPIEKPVEQPENPSPGARYKGLTVTHPVSGEPLTFTGEVKDNGNLIAKNNFGRERTIAPRDADKWLATPNEKTVAPTPETPKTELQPKKAEPEKRKYKEPKFQSLSQFVRKMGGIRPTREDTGETRRISNKEMQTSGLINKNSQHTAEDMARLAYEFGYLRDVFESAEHVNGNDFMDHVEADQSGHHKYYSSMDDTERFSDEHFQRQYEEYAQKQEDKQKAAEEYKRKQDDLLAKQAAFLNDSEAKKHLAKMAAGEYKTTYDSFAGLEPQNDATREYFNYLDSKGIPSYAHADDVLRAYQEAPQSNAGADSHTDAVEPQSNNAGKEEQVNLSRNFRAGTNDATLTFDSPLQRDLYDYYANERKALRGAGQRAYESRVKDLSDLKTSLASRLGSSESDVFDIARRVYEDVKAQMKGVAHGEERKVVDNVSGKTQSPQERVNNLDPQITAKVLYAKERGMTPSDIAQRYDLTPEDVESVGALPKVGQSGQFSHMLIKSLIPSKTGTAEERADKIAAVNDLASELNLPNARLTREAPVGDISNVVDAIRLTIAKELGHERLSHAPSADILKWLDGHGDRLTQETVETILGALGHQINHLETKVKPFLADKRLDDILERIDRLYGLDKIQDLDRIPNSDYKREILNLGYQYGLKRTAITRAYERASGNFQRRIAEGAGEGISQGRGSVSPAAGQEKALSQRGLSPEKKLDPVQDKDLIESLKEDGGALYAKDENPTLVAAHNLREDNLRFADRMGGLALPSVAITSKEIPFTGYGDITLLADKSLVDPKNRVPVTDADMYSPRYPSAQIHADRVKFEQEWEPVKQNWLDHYPKRENYSLEYYTPLEAIKDDGLQGLTRDDHFRAYALKSLGYDLPADPQGIYVLAREHEAEIEEFAQEFVDRADGELKFFKGYTNLGNRRYGDYNLDTVVKKLKSEMKDGENWNYGAANIRGHAARRFKSISEIQKSKHRLVNPEDMESVKEGMNTKLWDLAQEYAPYYKYDTERMGYVDQFTSALADGIKNRNLRRELEEYGFEGIDDLTPITDFLEELRNQPTEYFEAKPQRAVSLDEFKAAVIPSDASTKTRSILAKHGISVYEYKRGDTEDRKRAVASAAQAQGILFSHVPGQVDLWGNADTLHALQNTLFAPKSEAQLDRAEQKDLARAYGKTGDYIYRMLHSDDSQLASIATKLAEARFLAAQKEGGSDLVNDATDALDAFSYARKLKTSTQNILDQQGFDGKTFNDRLNDRSRSLLGAMEDGSFGKQFQLDLHNLKDSTPLFMVAWHGSPHVFDKFSTEKIGTGEGAQAYGYGLYFAGKEDVADYYKKQLEQRHRTFTYKGMPVLRALENLRDSGVEGAEGAFLRIKQEIESGTRNPIEVATNKLKDEVPQLERIVQYLNGERKHGRNNPEKLDRFDKHTLDLLLAHGADPHYNLDDKRTKLNAIRHFKESDFEISKGAKYKVDLKPAEDEYLLWDKPLSEQSAKVKKAVGPLISQFTPSYRWYTGGSLREGVWQYVDEMGHAVAHLTPSNGGAYTVHASEPIGSAPSLSAAKKLAENAWEVRNRMREAPRTGADLIREMEARPGTPKQVSDDLRSLGIRGIKYLDGTSRGKGDGSYNYVIFDDNDVEIQEVHYSKLDDESKLAKRIDSKIAQKSPLEIFKSAKFSVTPDGMLTAENMEALSIFTSAANGISKQSGGFIGAYFNRGQAFLLRLGLFDLHSGIKPEFKKSVGNLIAAIDRAIDPDHGDLTFAINIPQLPETSKYAQQEELTHRNNNRSGARQIFLEIASTPAIQKSLDHLAKSYDTFSPTDRVDEVIAKSFRDDAETELGISEDDIWNNLTSLWKGATDAGIDLNHYVDVQSQISERGRKFNEYVQGQRGQGDVTTQPERETVRGDGSGYLQAVRGTGTESGAITRPVSQDGVRAELQQGSVPEGSSGEGLMAKNLPLAQVRQFKTGRTVTFDYIRNTEKAPRDVNNTFAQNEEPAGKFLLERDPVVTSLAKGWEGGTVTFEHPLVIEWGNGSYHDPDNWKQVLAHTYNATGKKLSLKLLADGFDGIVTVNNGDTSEIVDLRVIGPRSVPLKAKRTITRRILNRIDKTLASQDISTTRALENIVNKNLQQLKKVDEDAFEQVVKLATTEAQATIEALQTGRRDPAILDAIRKRNYDDVKVTLTVAGVAQKYTAGMTHSGTLHGQPSTLVRIGDEQFIVQSWLARELKAVLDKPHDANVLQRFVDKLDSFGMAGPLDLFFHGTNVIATLIGGTPYVGTDVLSRTVGNTPVTKWITTLVQLWRSDPEALLQNDPQMLRDMADAGVIPQGYASETYAKRFAGTSELKSPLPFHRGLAPDLGPMLRGPKGLDIRSRILLWKVGKHMNPDATATEMHDFVNQLGIYNQKLQSQLVRFLQQSRLGKFSVAGTTMTKNGILAWLNKNPLPIEDLPLADRTWIRAQQQFSGGLLGIGLILWVALSKLYRGVFPWNDEKSQLLRIPLNDKDRHSWLVERIYGPEGDVFVNLAFFSPLLARGADALGISGAYNTGVLGGNKTQMAENAATGMINAAIHPVSTSPTTKAVFEGLTGNEMHVRGLRDKQGQAGMDLWPLDLPKGSGAGRRALEGALDLNPFIGNIIHSFGVNRSEKHPNLLTDSENRILLESLMEYTAPRLIKKTDVGKKRGFIQEQKRSMH